MIGLVLALVLTSSACGPSARSRGCTCAQPPCVRDPAAERARLELERWDLDTAVTGLSGLARAADGTLWALPEGHRALLSFRLDARGRPGRITEHALSGIAPTLESESLALLGEGLVAVGTERMEGDSSEGDEIDIVQIAGERRGVERRIRMPYARWRMQAVENTGIEGLCASEGVLLAAVEHAVPDGTRRFAHLGRLRLHAGAIDDDEWTQFRVWLTSDEGMIASLDCRAHPDGGLDVIAVERHFGIARLLRFRVAREGRGGDITPRLAADLGCALDEVPNFEGVVFLDDDRVALLTDNDFGGPEGPSRLFVMRLPR